ncbi:MAG: serine/threonine protein kinase/serine phosphatase RsbU (regulator of sigma subunit) [Rhodothermales bacterium]
MNGFPEDRATRLGELLLEALELEGEAREAFIDRACSGEEKNELRDLIVSYSEASGFFQSLASDLALPHSDTADPTPGTDEFLGRTFGQYKITSVVGRGGMGVVYGAEDTRLRRPAALKFLPRPVGTDQKSRDRFLREARSASALDHPNICTIYEVNESSDGETYIAMALYDGETLQDLISRGPVPADRAVVIAEQIAQGLAAAHARGIIHRDVKPGNVMLTADGGVKLLDFGLAKGEDSALITQDGAMLGTAAYMSPEQAAGTQSDHRADIWAFGVLFYEMLAGRRPFPGAYPQAVIYGILNSEPEPLTAIAPGVPIQLAGIVARALAKDLALRFSSCKDILLELETLKTRQESREEARQFVSALPTVEEEPDEVQEDTTLHILCVDDEPELELLMQQRFRKNIRAGDWKFVFALNGEDALQKLEGHPQIGLILTDLNMPRMDGLTLLTKLADLPRPTRTVVVSAYGDLEKIRTAMNRGAFDFVTKPIDFKDLETTIRKAADDLSLLRQAVNARHQLASVAQERDVARKIQEAMTPGQFPVMDGAEVYGFSAPARDVSGTFFDTFAIGDDRLALVQGDVSGRGVSSALLMAMAQTFLKSYLSDGVSPADALRKLHALPIAEGLPHLGLRAVVAVLNPSTGAVSVANAGHTSPLVRSESGEIRLLLKNDQLVWIGKGDFGVLDTAMEAGDLLLLTSSGIAESKGEDGSEFTLERLAAGLKALDSPSPKEVIRQVVREVYDHLGDAEPSEDLTLLTVQRT